MSGQKTTLQGFFDLNVRRAEVASTYRRFFRDNNLDAILMPPAPHTALPLDTWTTVTSTGLWNYLDYPAVVVPVDVVTDADSIDDASNAKYGQQDAELYKLCKRMISRCNTSRMTKADILILPFLDTGPEFYKGLPIAVQVVGYRHQDEALVATAGILDSIINGEEL